MISKRQSIVENTLRIQCANTRVYHDVVEYTTWIKNEACDSHANTSVENCKIRNTINANTLTF